MANIAHKGGLPGLISEIGFDVVKYFEGTITGTAFTLSIDPPAKRVIIRNTDTTTPVYLNVNGGIAVASASLTPDDNVKIPADAVFTMDFDSVSQLSLITSGPPVFIEGTLGWKGRT